jgi:hypothetical protein
MHDVPLKIPDVQGVQGLQQQLCLFDSETHCYWIYTFWNKKHVNCSQLPDNAVRGSYTPMLCHTSTMHSELQEHA